MWSNYTKTFVFRDCFDESMVNGNVEAINQLLNLEQHTKTFGAFITTDVLAVSNIAGGLEAYNSEDDGSWELSFTKENKEIASISIPYGGEVQLRFEIEEEVETGEFIIHYCTIKGFKEYQN